MEVVSHDRRSAKYKCMQSKIQIKIETQVSHSTQSSKSVAAIETKF